MSTARQLAARLRQSVQGCTLHLHGPVQAWAAIDQACAAGEANYEEVARYAIESCTRRIEELLENRTQADDKRVLKELKTRLFIERLLLGTTSMSQHQTPKLTVDAVVVNAEDPQKVALIERKNPPGGWALPGGFVEIGETVEQAVRRECREETNLKLDSLMLLGVYSDPQRDTRGHTVSVVFSSTGHGHLNAQDDAKSAKFFSLSKLPKLAFDHKKILNDFMNQAQVLET